MNPNRHIVDAGDRLASTAKQLYLLQAGLLLIAVACGLLFSGLMAAKAIALGGCLSLLASYLSARSVKRSSEVAYTKPDLAMVPLISGTLQKMIVIILGMAAGYRYLGLSPVYLIVGYLVIQAAYGVFAIQQSQSAHHSSAE